MPDDPAYHAENETTRSISPDDTNASRHQHNDGRGNQGRTPAASDAGSGDTAGRDTPPAGKPRTQRSPNSPWLGGG